MRTTSTRPSTRRATGFQIPMRGNEATIDGGHQWFNIGFQIPMRGNERNIRKLIGLRAEGSKSP